MATFGCPAVAVLAICAIATSHAVGNTTTHGTAAVQQQSPEMDLEQMGPVLENQGWMNPKLAPSGGMLRYYSQTVGDSLSAPRQKNLFHPPPISAAPFATAPVGQQTAYSFALQNPLAMPMMNGMKNPFSNPFTNPLIRIAAPILADPLNPRHLFNPALQGLRSPRITQVSLAVPPLPYPFYNEP